MNALQQTSIVFNNFSWPAVCGIVLLALIMGVMTYRSLRRGGSVAWSLALLALRVIAVIALGTIILEPQIIRRSGELMRGTVAVLHDVSGSMAMPAGGDNRTRQEVVAQTVGETFDGLEETHNVQYFDFGSQLKESSRDSVLSGRAGTMSETDVFGALKQLRGRVDMNALRGVVLVSDGRDTILPSDDSEYRRRVVKEAAGRLNVPVHSLYPVNAAGLRDVAIAEVRASRLAFVRDEWTARVEVETIGVEEGRLNVMLRRGESIVDVARARIQPGKSSYSVPLSFRPVRTGRKLFTVEVESTTDETYGGNNRTAIVLSVVRDKIRVLQVAGSPSWDVRFLRRTLKKMPIADLVSFFILRDRQDDPGGETPRSYVNLIPFPMRELFTNELSSFDVVVFQNFDYQRFFPGPRGFRGYLRNIRDHVRQNGAGFVMMGGSQSFGMGHYADTAIEDILPVELSQSGNIDERTFTANLTPLGQRHPITAISQDREANKRRWAAMPELHGCHVVSPNERSGGVLLENPVNDAPIMVPGRAGKGRSLALMTDGAWRWSFQAAGRGLGSDLYVQFWRNALRWLVQESEDKPLRLTVENRRLRPGQTLKGSVRLELEKEGADAGRIVHLQARRRGVAESLKQSVTTDETGRATFAFDLTRPGGWVVEARAEQDGGGSKLRLTDEISIMVQPGGRERRELRPDRGLLKEIAADSGGRVFDLIEQAPPDNLPIDSAPVERLSSRDVQPLWNNWWAFALIVGCLSLEWWLRRRRGVT